MKRRSQLCWFFSAAGLLILILDGKTAVSGAAEGIELCLKTAIPALFPFFVLSAAFLRSEVSFPGLERVLTSLFGFPPGLGSLALPCFLGGYPVGAREVFQAYSDGRLHKTEAERLLAFCNNAGPAFIFGMVGQMFPRPWMPWALWGIHIVGALAAARCVSGRSGDVRCVEKKPGAKGDLMAGATATMGIVCGWIVLVRVLITFLDKWVLWRLPQTAHVALIGLTELSNGCWELSRISSTAIRFILCSGMLAAGGLCVTAQTISVTGALSLHDYYVGKLIQILVSLVLSSCIMFRTVFPLLFLLIPGFYLICKKRSGNQALSGV